MSSITHDEAERIARILFADDFHDGTDCKNEVGRIGQPCRICEDQRKEWLAIIDKVQNAVNNNPSQRP